MASMKELGMRIMRLLALALELPATFFDDKFTKPMLFLRPLHYTPEPSDPSKGIFGAGAHSDCKSLCKRHQEAQAVLQMLLLLYFYCLLGADCSLATLLNIAGASEILKEGASDRVRFYLEAAGCRWPHHHPQD